VSGQHRTGRGELSTYCAVNGSPGYDPKYRGKHALAELFAAGRTIVRPTTTTLGDLMKELSGKTSDRIRRGEIDADPLAPRAAADDRPQADSVRHGSGHALGDPARSDRTAQTHDE
jgi:hypothetical protein